MNPTHACAYVPAGKGAETKVESGPRPPLLVPDVVVKCLPVPLGSVLPMVVPPGLKWVQLGQTAILHPPSGKNNTPAKTTSPWWVAELSTHGVKLVSGSKNEPVVKYVSWAEASSSLVPYHKSTSDRYQASGSKRPASKTALHGAGVTSASQQPKVTAAAAAAANAVGRGKFPSPGSKSLGSIRPGAVVPSVSTSASSASGAKKKSPTNAGSASTPTGTGRKLTAAQKALQLSLLKRELADFYRKVNKEKVSQVGWWVTPDVALSCMASDVDIFFKGPSVSLWCMLSSCLDRFTCL